MSPKSTVLVPKLTKLSSPIEGVSEEMNSIASQNMDFTPARRRIRSAFVDVQQQLDHCLFKMAPPGMRTEESWLPKPGVRIKGVWCFCHGYGDSCTFFFKEDMSPPESVLKFITLLFKVGLKAKLFPQKDLAELTFRELSKRKLVSSQLLVLHGAADKATDPLVSKFLYEKASSKYKTLKIYEEGCHCSL